MGQDSVPIQIEHHNYEEGDTFSVVVGFNWNGVPA